MSSLPSKSDFNFVKYQVQINEEFQKLSNLYFDIANYFSSFISNNKTISFTNSDTISNTFNKRKRNRNLFENKIAISPENDGKVIKVECLENGKRIPGFQAEIKYRELELLLGPYKSLKFVSYLKKTLQDELASLKCSKNNYKGIVHKIFEEIKHGLNKEFPVLEIVRNEDCDVKLLGNTSLENK